MRIGPGNGDYTSDPEPAPGPTSPPDLEPPEPPDDSGGGGGGISMPSLPSVPSLPTPDIGLDEPDWDGDGEPGGNLSGRLPDLGSGSSGDDGGNGGGGGISMPSLPSVPSLPTPDIGLDEPDWDGDGEPGGNLIPEVPEFDLPQVEVPEFDLPQVEVPEFDLPQVPVPDLSGIGQWLNNPQGNVLPEELLTRWADFLAGSTDEAVGRGVQKMKLAAVGAAALIGAYLLTRGDGRSA